MSQGFANTVKEVAKTVNQRNNSETATEQSTEKATEKRAVAGALTTTDSLRQKAAKSAAGLAKVEQESKRLQIQEAVIEGRKDADDIALAYAVGNLDQMIRAKSEVVLQLQAGKAKIHSATDEELIAYVEVGIDESDVEESMGNLLSYSARSGENTPSQSLLTGIF